MPERFFIQTILNSPYQYPVQHWELDEDGQPTHKIIELRRPAEFITPIPKPRRRRDAAQQLDLALDEGRGLSSAEQVYDTTGNINTIRKRVDQWREIPNSNDWKVTPETAHLLSH